MLYYFRQGIDVTSHIFSTHISPEEDAWLDGSSPSSSISEKLLERGVNCNTATILHHIYSTSRLSSYLNLRTNLEVAFQKLTAIDKRQILRSYLAEERRELRHDYDNVLDIIKQKLRLVSTLNL